MSKANMGKSLIMLSTVVVLVAMITVVAMSIKNSIYSATIEILPDSTEDAVIILDGNYIGSKRSIKVRPGTHRIYAIRNDFFPDGRVFTVLENEIYDIDFSLEPYI